MPDVLSKEELEALRQYDSCTISNAIETFKVRPFNVGFTSHEMVCRFPDLPRMVGYATTAVIAADMPAPADRAATSVGYSRSDYYDHVVSVPEPRIAVVRDLDPVPLGSFWGEVNSNVHRAMGCLGTITHGGIRDLDEMHALGFQSLSTAVLVSHAYVHLVDFGVPVKVAGMEVKPGDLIHADKHGAIQIPLEIARDLPKAIEELTARERTVIDLCQSPDFSVEKLKNLRR
jgi:4-hydroxy-4-methyl-2-oxoglutarate aldolase